MKYRLNILGFLMGLSLLPGLAAAQVEIQDLSLNPSIICYNDPVTITYQAALPQNNVQTNDSFFLFGSFSATKTPGANDYYFIYYGENNGGAGTPILGSTWLSSNDNWAQITPAFGNYITYTAVTTIPNVAPYNSGPGVVYLTLQAANVAFQNAYVDSSAVSLQLAVTVNCTESDAINVGGVTFVSGGVTYTGASSPVTMLIEQCASLTSTPTSTPTATITSARTLTPTFTASPTQTFQFSPTVTNTPTVTITPMATNSPTITPTTTVTNSPTITPTTTVTNSPTITPTATVTNSFTNTATATNSWTVTNTSTTTNSPTVTTTPTFTASPTVTATPTITATPNLTTVVTMSKVASENIALGGDTLTYTIGITVTGDAVNGLAVTDILPPNVSFVTFGAVPNGWPAPVYTASVSQLSWTAPSPLAIGVYQLTYQTKVNSLIAGGTVISNHAVMSFPGGAPVTSVFNVQVVGQYTVSVNVYNSAGELVKQISVQEMTSSVNAITLSGNLITALTGTGSSVNIYYGDYYLGSWNGTTSSGTPVSNGTYYLKVDTVTSLGSETSVTQPITVDRSYAQLIVNIYNSAGEVVKHLYAVVDNPQGIEMTNVALSSAVVTPGGNPSQPSNLQILVQTTSGNAVTLTWNGTGDNGSQVSPGVYELEAQWNDGAGGTEDITKEIVVQPGTDNNGMIVAEPNVLDQKNGTTITFVINSSQVFTVNFKIYTIAGELVRSTVKQSGPNWASFDSSPLASGLYLAEVEAVNSSNQVLQRRLLKFTVLH